MLINIRCSGVRIDIVLLQVRVKIFDRKLYYLQIYFTDREIVVTHLVTFSVNNGSLHFTDRIYLTFRSKLSYDAFVR